MTQLVRQLVRRCLQVKPLTSLVTALTVVLTMPMAHPKLTQPCIVLTLELPVLVVFVVMLVMLTVTKSRQTVLVPTSNMQTELLV